MKISNLKLAIGVPCDFPFVPKSFLDSFVLMEKPSFIYIHADNGPIDTLRNDIVETALQTEATHLLMMDVDQVYDPKTVTKLLAHRLPVVGAKVCRRYPPFDPIIMKITDLGYQPIEDYEPGSLVECDATGTGCILYDMEVFRKLPRPWFRFQKDPANGMVIGEDIGFCQDLKTAGYRIFVDTSIEIGHLTTMIVNQATHDLYRAMKVEQARKKAALGVMEA
ncbi:MAG: glycosyltransferase family protein [Syntrophorhabdaceae bacterium]